MPGVVRKTSGGGCSVKPRPVRYDMEPIEVLVNDLHEIGIVEEE